MVRYENCACLENLFHDECWKDTQEHEDAPDRNCFLCRAPRIDATTPEEYEDEPLPPQLVVYQDQGYSRPVVCSLLFLHLLHSVSVLASIAAAIVDESLPMFNIANAPFYFASLASDLVDLIHKSVWVWFNRHQVAVGMIVLLRVAMGIFSIALFLRASRSDVYGAYAWFVFLLLVEYCIGGIVLFFVVLSWCRF